MQKSDKFCARDYYKSIGGHIFFCSLFLFAKFWDMVTLTSFRAKKRKTKADRTRVNSFFIFLFLRNVNKESTPGQRLV